MTNWITRRGFLGGTMGAGLGLMLSGQANPGAATDPPGARLLHRIDCTQDFGPDQYFGFGNVRVVEGAAGRYREAEAVPMSRFGYRFPIEHIGKPHVAVIRYPDDKRRYMCIMDGTCYDLTTGVFTGWAQPLTGQMVAIRQVFWPRWQDCSIVFMTWSHGEPAAVSSIEIFELDALPPVSVPADLNDGSRRELGIQYEDPCGAGASEGAMNRDEWLDHVVQYMRYSGQKLLVYPMAWYAGPQFPSDREPADGFDCTVARDRRQYSRWTTHPADWYASMLERFAQEGLEYQGALTLMRLGSLLQKMNIDIEAIKAGADTYNNMMWNNSVQSSTGDWTPFYNARNFVVLAEMLKDGSRRGPGVPKYVYGETPNGNHMCPMFNPLHPTVQEAILGFVREIGQRYAKYPAFKGISFNMFGSCMPWFGSIHAGYDDLSIRLFEQETGISVPVDAKAPDRFSRRYEHLTYVCRPAWVAWRCGKIRDLFGEIHAALAAARSDLRVTITLWDETIVINTLGSISPALQYGARPSMFDLYRDAGIDISLYGDAPGLEIDRSMGNPRDRGGHGNATGGATLPPAELCMYRDFDFLDEKALDACHAHARPGAFVFNCWVEAWGEHVWFQPEPGDPNAAELAVMDGKPAEGVLRINSQYPKDGFWWDSQLRITPPFQGGVHFLEPYAHAVAELDACRITRGGLFLDKAHSELLQRFAPAYRALPREKFATVGAATDPVAVRTLVRDGRRYLYAVNREYYPIPIEVQFAAAPNGLLDLATGETIQSPLQWPLLLGPYELRSFALSPEVSIAGFKAAPPADVVASLTADAESAFAAFASLRAAGKPIPGMDQLEIRMRAALAEGRVAWLRRALTSYIVRQARLGRQ